MQREASQRNGTDDHRYVCLNKEIYKLELTNFTAIETTVRENWELEFTNFNNLSKWEYRNSELQSLQ